MTVPELLQLYAPLAGMLALAFWVGMLSQRVADLKEDVAALKMDSGDGGSTERLVRLEVQMEGVKAGVDKLNRGLDSMNRQMGNLMQKGGLAPLNP